MMTIKVDPSGLKETKWHEYALRFVAGGIITILAGLIARKWGSRDRRIVSGLPGHLPGQRYLDREP